MSLEETGDTTSKTNQFELAAGNSILGDEGASQPLQSPTVSTPDEIIARQASLSDAQPTGLDSNPNDFEGASETKPAPKSEWL